MCRSALIECRDNWLQQPTNTNRLQVKSLSHKMAECCSPILFQCVCTSIMNMTHARCLAEPAGGHSCHSCFLLSSVAACFFIRIPPISPWPKSESANGVDTRLANELTGRQTVKQFRLTTIRFRSFSVAYQNNSEWGWSYCRGRG